MRQKVLEFARAELNQGLQERDARGEFNHAGWRRCADFGIQGLPIPTAYGGTGADALTTVGVLEQLGYGCEDNGIAFSLNAHMWTVEMPLLCFGSEQQRQRLLPGLVRGELIGASALTEPGAGSDAYSLTTSVARRGDRYVLNGNKVFISNGNVADVLVVYATHDRSKGASGISAFLVEKHQSNFHVVRTPEKMGLRTSPMAEIFFEHCEVPAENLLGKEGGGADLFTQAMTWERSCILASAVGAMQRLLDTSIQHARTRKQFGQPIGKFQLIASKIVDMKMRIETARALLYRAAWLRDQGRSIYLESAMAKLHISECWVKTAEDALQIHGGYGYMRECGIERELRDALGSRIYSGTSEIQRMLIASLVGL